MYKSKISGVFIAYYFNGNIIRVRNISYLNDCLHLKELSPAAPHPQDIELVHTIAQVKVNDDVNFSFSESSSDLIFKKDLERLNFTEISIGTCFVSLKKTDKLPLTVLNEQGQDVTQQFFTINGSRLEINRSTIPSMLTLNECVIRQDCLCYLMERIQL